MEDVYSRIERFRYYFVAFEIAGVGSRYRSMNLSEFWVNLHEVQDTLCTVWSLIWLYDSKRMLPEAFAMQLSRDVMTPSISEALWPLRGVWIRLRCSFGSSISIHDMASYIWDVDEACFVATCEYLRYLGIVRTMPTYLIWGTPALWGQCLRTLFEILRYCEDNAYVSSLASGYLIWKSTLWSLYLWPTADVWLLQ